MSPPVVRHRYAQQVDELAELGYDPATIARRLGLQPRSLQRIMYRAGRPDLGRLFEPLVAQARAHSCADCGAPCSHTAARCVPCGYRTRRTNRKRAAGTPWG